MTTSVLKLTDGTTTKNFSTGDNMKLVRYEPVASLDGSRITETAEVHFTAAIATNRANIQAINKLFEQARNYERTQTGARVYIQFDPGSSGTAWRSRVYNGRVVLNDTVLGPWQYDTRLTLSVEWTRDAFWEGALTQLPLTNGNGTDDTSGLTLDEGNNFVTVDGVNDVTGDMPAPIKIEMYNSYSSATPTDEIRIHHNVFSSPTSLTHILEGESATGAGVVSTAESGAAASGNNYAAISWTATTETKIATWALSAAQLAYMAGGRFAIIARWYGAFPYSNCYLRMKLEGASGVLYQGDLLLVPNTRELYLLDTTRLPPYLYGLANIKGINLTLYALRNASGTHTINLDYLQLSCISGNAGWKRFLSVNAGIAYQEYFYHDDTEGFDYRVDTSGDKIGEFTGYGGPVLLVPGYDQRLYFLSCDTGGAAKIEQTWVTKLWYRPRRNSL